MFQITALESRAPLKKVVFWSNSYKIIVMVTSLIEMLELPNLGHMTALRYNFIQMIKVCCSRHGQKL